MAPLIGITTYPRNDDGSFTLPALYVAAVRRAGGLVVLIPPGEPRPDALLDRVDGLLLTGGGDLDPDLYGGRRHETIYGVNAERDAGEIALVRSWLPRRKPLLGICRGCQVINVALGGTLIEHLPDVAGEEVLHRLPPRRPGRHDIRVQADSVLARVLGQTSFPAASWHHQAIRQPAEALRPVAWAPDGVIEGVEMPEHPWLLAVQWHPELTAAEDPLQQRLFTALVDAANQEELPGLSPGDPRRPTRAFG